jgi:hypothetical protein
MIHCIYRKSKPKSSWHLVSVATSPEMANQEVDAFLKQAIADGNEDAKVGIKIFDTVFWIPEFLNEIKEETPAFN